MRRGHQGRVDANHADVVAVFRAAGCEVESLARLGKGAPDLLVSWLPALTGHDWTLPYMTALRARRVALVEVKTAHGRLTPDQLKFHQRFPVWMVRTDADAAQVVAWLKQGAIQEIACR